jgi:hypothetical protein
LSFSKNLMAVLATILLVMSMVLVVEVPDADAQMEIKRSTGTAVRRDAGSMQRSSGTRRGNDLGSKKKGSDSEMSTRRTSNSDEDEADEDESDRDASSSDYVSGEKRSNSDSDDDADDEAAVDYEHRTLGRACMYGSRGEVLYRPSGSICRGDAKKRPAPEQAEKRSPSEPSARRGSCIHGAQGNVIYSPPGADCEAASRRSERSDRSRSLPAASRSVAHPPD